MKHISVRLWIQMLFLIAITLALLWMFQIEFLDRFYTDWQLHNIKELAYNVAEMIDKSKDKQLIEDKIDQLSIKYAAQVYVVYVKENSMKISYASYGGIQATPTGIYRMLSTPIYTVLDSVMKSKAEVIRQIKHLKFASGVMVIGIPVRLGDELSKIIVISTPLAPVNETISVLKQQLLIVTLILVVISLFLTYHFSKSFTKPILEINKAAHEMAGGNLSVKVDVKWKDELGMLSDTINNLALQLQKIEELRKELIANVSHELRTPLSLIKGYAETVRDVSGDHIQKRNKHLSIIIEESDRLSNIIDDMLELSQIQSEYFQLEASEFNIVETAKSVINKLFSIDCSKTADIQIISEFDYMMVHGDEARLEQVLYNILSNAIKFTPEEGKILLDLRRKDTGCIIIEVSDNGRGIPKEELKYIWDRFYKANMRENSKVPGNGLGLSIVKGILEAHGSNYGVESELGKGTKFWFTLQLIKAY